MFYKAASHLNISFSTASVNFLCKSTTVISKVKLCSLMMCFKVQTLVKDHTCEPQFTTIFWVCLVWRTVQNFTNDLLYSEKQRHILVS